MTHPGERPHIPAPINRQTTPGRIPVPSSIGHSNAAHAQPSRTVEDIANLVYGDPTTQSLLDRNTLKSMPQWALALMNQNRLMSIELATFYQIMIDRGMLTTHEISRYRRAIQREHDLNFQRMVDQLGRQLKQQPTLFSHFAGRHELRQAQLVAPVQQLVDTNLFHAHAARTPARI